MSTKPDPYADLMAGAAWLCASAAELCALAALMLLAWSDRLLTKHTEK